jgi:DNA repair ATPase RecN
MKKIIFILAVTITIMAGTIFTSCQSSIQKQEAAQAKVRDAKQDLNAAQKDANAAAQVVATAEEWKAFRSESELKIKDNEIRITELNVKMKKPGEIFDALYAKKIANLEQQNKDMRARLEAYEKSQSNWESFKREFNHDMDAIGQALKDLTVDNKK